MSAQEKFAGTFQGLLELVERLRGPEGCPWDREQTAESMRRHLLEECYELVQAIEDGDDAKLVEELGDVMFHLAFQVRLGQEQGALTDEQVFRAGIDKLVRRHPHVFGDAVVSDADEAITRWDAIKRRERAGSSESILDGVPHSMPALFRAQVLQERAARTGFDWEDAQGVLRKVAEEVEELQKAETQDQKQSELGDILFSIVNVARWLDVDAEEALRETDSRFRTRFVLMERLSRERGVPLDGLSLAEKEALWQEAKQRIG